MSKFNLFIANKIKQQQKQKPAKKIGKPSGAKTNIAVNKPNK